MLFYALLFCMISLQAIEWPDRLAIPEGFKFHKTIDTLETIRQIIMNQEKGAYLRFGDGDINLAYGKVDMMQEPNPRLQQEMREAFALDGPTVLKCIPLYCKEFDGYEEGMDWNVHLCGWQGSQLLLDDCKVLWGAPITDVYSHVALCFAATQYQEYCFEFLSFLKTQRIILIGNQFIPDWLRQLLFSEECVFIPAPARQSYLAIDRLEEQVLAASSGMDGYKVIITSMGCSGRPLQKRLWQQLDHVFLFDFGSLMDALAGWHTREWIRVTQFDPQNFVRNLLQYQLNR